MRTARLIAGRATCAGIVCAALLLTCGCQSTSETAGEEASPRLSYVLGSQVDPADMVGGAAEVPVWDPNHPVVGTRWEVTSVVGSIPGGYTSIYIDLGGDGRLITTVRRLDDSENVTRERYVASGDMIYITDAVGGRREAKFSIRGDEMIVDGPRARVRLRRAGTE